jgi:hypothetical protein
MTCLSMATVTTMTGDQNRDKIRLNQLNLVQFVYFKNFLNFTTYVQI